MSNMTKASAVILNSLEALEQDALEALTSINPNVYTIGPFSNLVDQLRDKNLLPFQPNFITVMTANQATEFAWGLANSKKSFLWIIRPDLVSGNSAMLPEDFVRETSERGHVG
ncbi:hypothetical protein LIER_37779 [Lithospermum erythrorhizon]|uniref:Uncharacterized protein n=1 Tax=Lithospermum erythrorhizon TaxID=34254 RepID=A0AAV3PSE0_LITER